MKRLSKILFLIPLCFYLTGQHAMAQLVEHVVIISIDGFRSDFYTDPSWPTPNLRQLAAQGVYAEGVRGIFPTVTYPSHTTLITGTLPEAHGIYYNATMNDLGETGRWIYDFGDVKAETLWEAAKKQGLTTASVSWPITANCPYIDYNIPEIWSMDNPADRRGATSQYATPKGLYEEVEKYATGEMEMNDYNLSSLSMDENLSRIAGYILKKYKPNLLTIHLPNTDGAQHKDGREGNGVQRAIAGADHAVSHLYDALKKAGILDKTAIIITGDHGFVTTYTSIAPNLWLEDIGLLKKGDENWKAVFFSAGGSTFLHLKNPNDKKTLDKVKGMLATLPPAQKKLFRVVSREEMDTRGADPHAALALTAVEGFCFNNEKEGPLLRAARGGKHGYFPEFDHIRTGFIGYGPAFQPGAVLTTMNLEDVPVMAAHLLGISLPNAVGISYPIYQKEDVKK